jgi:hypothetical protein
VTSEERERIQAAARRYVRDQAPTPPVAVLERVARIILQARTPTRAAARPLQPLSPSRVDPRQHDAGGSREGSQGAA